MCVIQKARFVFNAFVFYVPLLQAYAMVERIGYPEFLFNDTELDDMYKEVQYLVIYRLRTGFSGKEGAMNTATMRPFYVYSMNRL
jgi:hypothetical protein